MRYILRKEEYGKGRLELQHAIDEGEVAYPVLLFENGKKKHVWRSYYGRHSDAVKCFEALVLALRLGRGISSTTKEE